MAKTNNTKQRADGAATAVAGADPAPESLDKVRDILFGGQMRMVESRLQSIEARFQEQLKTLRNDYTRQLSDLDGSVRKELAALTDRLAAERAKRAEDLKALASSSATPSRRSRSDLASWKRPPAWPTPISGTRS